MEAGHEGTIVAAKFTCTTLCYATASFTTWVEHNISDISVQHTVCAAGHDAIVIVNLEAGF